MISQTFYSGVCKAYLPFFLRALTVQHPKDSFVLLLDHAQDIDVVSTQIEALMPSFEVLRFHAYDALPYDRVSPSPDILASRVKTRVTLTEKSLKPICIITTVQAALQYLPPCTHYAASSLYLKPGMHITHARLFEQLVHLGFRREESVFEVGDFSVRGGIIDFFPSTHTHPVRIDFFGDDIENLRAFDVLTQKTMQNLDHVTLLPAQEIILNEATIGCFRQKYREHFAHVPDAYKDPAYEALSGGRPYPGMEQYLPLFFENTTTLLDILPNAHVVQAQDAQSVMHEFLGHVEEYYCARQNPIFSGDQSARPLPPSMLFTTAEVSEQKLSMYATSIHTTFDHPSAVLNLKTKPRSFSSVRPNLPQWAEDIKDLYASSQRCVVLSAKTKGAQERLSHFLDEFHLSPLPRSLPDLPRHGFYICIAPFDHGFDSPDFTLITDQDIFGDRSVRAQQKRRKAENFFEALSTFEPGDIIVHTHHGIGRFEGLEPLLINEKVHDCLRLIYEGHEKLFLPVENIDLITRYGGDQTLVQLDKLGSSAWKNKKARVKKRLMVVADYLIQMAAKRQLQEGERIIPDAVSYQNFCAKFPYNETQDQERAIHEALADLASGRPMDRLVCGDVGFGKTEIALRAAFATVSAGKQVAVITPTSLLCRQHFQTFSKRFEGSGYHVDQLSRLTSSRNVKKTLETLPQGEPSVVVATHALFSPKIHFKDLGLVIVDEEQHFGVKQKETLKKLKNNVHVLTMTATPIPRTLQLAVTGVRDLSLITTPPVDRLAVRTFIMPFDGVSLREAVLREYHRGGQTFVVTPRVLFIEELERTFRTLTPDIKIAVVHGQMSSTQLEDTMSAFYDRQYDLLIATNIIESGIDIPTANTLIVHRSDLFGLSQLYQLRGRVGRAKAQGYAYFTYDPKMMLRDVTRRRLEILGRLDTLGSGFSLASHDMDLRGAGNIVGEEQSGHIREVGVELYQRLLQEAILMARAGEGHAEEDVDIAPQINMGTAVLIPENYVSDLNLRLTLYRRIAALKDHESLEDLRQELIDRFGPIPQEVRNLFDVIGLKALCQKAHVERLDVGAKGVVIGFKNNVFPNPDGLIAYLQKVGNVKIRPDQRVAFTRLWKTTKERLMDLRTILSDLQNMC